VRSNPATIITPLDRKPAERSEFSSSFSSTSDNEYNVNGADSPIPELPFQGGFIAVYRRYFNALVRRAPGIQLPIAIYILGQTESAARRPEYAEIHIKEFVMLTGASERMNWRALAKLEKNGLMKRNGRGGFKVCLENIDGVKLRSARTCRRNTKDAAVRAPESIAALHLGSVEEESVSEDQETERQFSECDAGEFRCQTRDVAPRLFGNPADERAVDTVGREPSDRSTHTLGSGDGRTEGGVGGSDGREADAGTGTMAHGEPVVAVHDGRSEPELESGYVVITRRQFAILTAAPTAVPLNLASVKTDADFKKPETYCPWNWTCPHLSTTSELVSIKAVKHNYTTTTAARAPAGENPYLARFTDPAALIGDALHIDDAAARRMWRESVAVNPAITPREFVLVAGMKLAEWRRVDDSRPGLKIRNVRGLLIRSMPNAVQGALYLAAHEQAPLDLARDVYQAREILAGDDPAQRDRAWALGILSESQT
jgi:hypothetical protein